MNVLSHGPIGRPSIWKAQDFRDPWVVEYWVNKTIHEEWFPSWKDALSFALAQASA